MNRNTTFARRACWRRNVVTTNEIEGSIGIAGLLQLLVGRFSCWVWLRRDQTEVVHGCGTRVPLTLARIQSERDRWHRGTGGAVMGQVCRYSRSPLAELVPHSGSGYCECGGEVENPVITSGDKMIGMHCAECAVMHYTLYLHPI